MKEPQRVPLRLGVVVPAHQAEREIERCLGGLLAAGFDASEIVVVDDGSRDGTGDRARAAGVRVMRNDPAAQPAEARNRGARALDVDVLVFVDADVVVHADARSRIEGHFGRLPGLAAVFGSYDTAPPAPATVSRYRNLLHHFVHQQGREEASTFWTGFGAVRRDRFLELGGFDRDWQAIEDVELGLRLRQAGGQIRLDRNMLCTHLKAWTVASMFRTDFPGRAVPWTRLILHRDGPRDDLNFAMRHRASAASVALGGVSASAALLNPVALVAMGPAVVGFVAANYAFLRFLAAVGGFRFAIAATPFHALHYVAAMLGYAQVRLLERRPPRHAPDGAARRV